MVEGGKVIVSFTYGCACHDLSLIIKDTFKIDEVKVLFKVVVTMSSYFKARHRANHLLRIESEKQTTVLQTIKTICPTKWNGCSVMSKAYLDYRTAFFDCRQAILDCRQAISNIFCNEMTKPLDKELLLDITDSK